MNKTEEIMKTKIAQSIESTAPRSAWGRGVKSYALELLEELEGEDITRETLLNGADDWHAYSWGGCSLIYDCQIAERLCTPSELKRKRGGELQPSTRENWLDCQERALRQACALILRHVKTICE